INAMFDHPTIAMLAAYLRSAAPKPSTRPTYTSRGLTLERATVPQEYFYYLDRDVHDPTSYYATQKWRIEGPLDAELLARSYRELADSHGVFRTAFREIDGRLHQVVRSLDEARPPDLELRDATGSAEDEA